MYLLIFLRSQPLRNILKKGYNSTAEIYINNLCFGDFDNAIALVQVSTSLSRSRLHSTSASLTKTEVKLERKRCYFSLEKIKEVIQAYLEFAEELNQGLESNVVEVELNRA